MCIRVCFVVLENHRNFMVQRLKKFFPFCDVELSTLRYYFSEIINIKYHTALNYSLQMIISQSIFRHPQIIHVRDFIFSHFLSYLINICVFTTISKFSDTNYDNRIVTFVQDCHINWLLQMITFAIIPSKRASYLYINIQMWFSSINIFFLISFFTANTTCYKKQMIQELHNAANNYLPN